MPQSWDCTGNDAAPDPSLLRVRGLSLLPGFTAPVLDALSPAPAVSLRGGKGKDVALAMAAPCGSNLRAAGAAGPFRSPQAGSQIPADTAAPGGSSSLAQDAAASGGDALLDPSPFSCASPRRVGSSQPWVLAGDGALQHTATIQPCCRACPCVNSPGSGPQWALFIPSLPPGRGSRCPPCPWIGFGSKALLVPMEPPGKHLGSRLLSPGRGLEPLIATDTL